MDKEPKSGKKRSSRSKQLRPRSLGKPRRISQSSQAASITTNIEELEGKIALMMKRISFIQGKIQEELSKKENSGRNIFIKGCEQQINVLKKGLEVLQLKLKNMTELWVASLTISDVKPVVEFPPMKKKKQAKKEKIDALLKRFVSDQE